MTTNQSSIPAYEINLHVLVCGKNRDAVCEWAGRTATEIFGDEDVVSIETNINDEPSEWFDAENIAES